MGKKSRRSREQIMSKRRDVVDPRKFDPRDPVLGTALGERKWRYLGAGEIADA
jgi:hypothetical protein